MWAWWAVAAAFGMRVTAADRDLVLDVWQRPSHGRAGDVEAVIGSQRPHRFGYADPVPLAELLPESAPREFTWPAKLTITWRGPDAHPKARVGVSVLLLRLGHQRWGPLPDVHDEPEPAHMVHLKVDDAVGVTPNRSSYVAIHELRCVRRPAVSSRGRPCRRSSPPRPTGSNASPPSWQATPCCLAPPCCLRQPWGWGSPSARFTAPGGRRTSGPSSTGQVRTPWSCRASTWAPRRFATRTEAERACLPSWRCGASADVAGLLALKARRGGAGQSRGSRRVITLPGGNRGRAAGSRGSVGRPAAACLFIRRGCRAIRAAPPWLRRSGNPLVPGTGQRRTAGAGGGSGRGDRHPDRRPRPARYCECRRGRAGPGNARRAAPPAARSASRGRQRRGTPAAGPERGRGAVRAGRCTGSTWTGRCRRSPGC